MATEKKKKNHKYIARIAAKKQTKDYKFRYFYTQKSYKAYLDGLKPKTTKKEEKSKTTKKEEKSKTTIGSILKQSLNSITSLITSGKKSVEKSTASTKSTKTKIADLDSYMQYASKGEEAVRSILEKTNKSKVLNTNAKKIIEDQTKKTVVKIFDTMRKTKENSLGTKLDTDKESTGSTNNPILSNLNKKDKTYTSDEDRAAVNPNYDPESIGYSNNCAYCSVAYDLRKRGYDVEARPIDERLIYASPPEGDEMHPLDPTTENVLAWYGLTESDMVSEDEIMKSYHDPELYYELFRAGSKMEGTKEDVQYEAIDDWEKARNKVLTEYMERLPEGSRGMMNLRWSGGGGHSVVWEIENGKLHIRDAQTNEEYSMNYIWLTTGDFECYRTDNIEPTETVLRLVKNKEKER